MGAGNEGLPNLRPVQTSARNRNEAQQAPVWSWPHCWPPAPGHKWPNQPWPQLSLAIALCLFTANGLASHPVPAGTSRSLYGFQDTAVATSFPIASNPPTLFVLSGLLSLSNTWYLSTLFTLSPNDPASHEGHREEQPAIIYINETQIAPVTDLNQVHLYRCISSHNSMGPGFSPLEHVVI